MLPIFIGSLTLHELAHGLVAYQLGDPTAKLHRAALAEPDRAHGPARDA